MAMKNLLTLFCLICSPISLADTLGSAPTHVDIGAVKTKGTLEYNAADQTYTITASGTNMWAGQDELHYAYQQIKGDFILLCHSFDSGPILPTPQNCRICANTQPCIHG